MATLHTVRNLEPLKRQPLTVAVPLSISVTREHVCLATGQAHTDHARRYVLRIPLDEVPALVEAMQVFYKFAMAQK